MAEEPTQNPLAIAALSYAANGWHVVPLHTIRSGACTCGKPECPSPGKHPRTINGLHSASDDVNDVEYFWDKWPDSNIGIVAGPSKLAIVDLDSADAITRWKALNLGTVTRYAKTGKGMHLYYADPTQTGNPSVGDGIDLRAANSYVVAPPSIHVSGATYTWVNAEHPIAVAPLDLLAWFTKRRTEQTKASDGQPIPSGQRNNTLISLAGSARKRGHTEPEILALLEATNHARCDPPMGAYELAAIATQAASWPLGSPDLQDAVFWGALPIEPAVDINGDPVPDELPLENWSTFRDTSTEEITWLADGLIAESSLIFLAGPPKSGKTWIAIDLAVRIATGTPFLDRHTTAQPVLYVALEGHRSAIRTRIAILARGAGINPASTSLDNLHVLYKPPGIDIASPAWAAKITRAAAAIDARLVVVDVLRAAAPRMREDGQGATDFAQIRENLAPLQTTRCAVVLLHHFAKLSEATKGRSIGERMSGSGALFGHADLVLGITASEDGAKRMRLEGVGRDTAAFDAIGLALHGEGTGEYGGYGYTDTVSLEVTEDAPTAETIKAPAEEIRDWILDQPQRQAKPLAIRKQFDISEGTLRERRPQLLALGIEYQTGGIHTVYYAI